MEDLLSLRNRTALVVGAASAIGSAPPSDLACFVNGALLGVDGGLLP
jgi:hypothetical protein